MILKNSLIIVLLITLLSCVNATQSDLEVVPCEDTFTYTDCVKTIIDNNCVICHHSGADAIGPFALETYEQVRSVAENGAMLDRIQRADGADGIMPQTGKMPQSNIDVILAWAEQNYEE